MLGECGKVETPSAGDFLGARHAPTFERVESALLGATDDWRDCRRTPDEI